MSSKGIQSGRPVRGPHTRFTSLLDFGKKKATASDGGGNLPRAPEHEPQHYPHLDAGTSPRLNGRPAAGANGSR